MESGGWVGGSLSAEDGDTDFGKVGAIRHMINRTSMLRCLCVVLLGASFSPRNARARLARKDNVNSRVREKALWWSSVGLDLKTCAWLGIDLATISGDEQRS
jgi:hypothetical protein